MAKSASRSAYCGYQYSEEMMGWAYTYIEVVPGGTFGRFSSCELHYGMYWYLAEDER